MSKKDEASPRQRIIMEQRWAKAREECPAGTCVPASRFHIAGCTRRADRKVTITNMVTGQVTEAELKFGDVAPLREALKAQNNQAALLEPSGDNFPQEYWDATEARFVEYTPEPDRIERLREHYDNHDTSAEMETAPARPWWKFWGRRRG